MTKEDLEKIFVDVASTYDDVYEMRDALDSMLTSGVITADDMDYLNANWDDLLIKNNLQ